MANTRSINDINIANIANPTATTSTPAVMVNGQTIFTVGNSDILILSLISECYSANNATASTLQYSVTSLTGTASISGVSVSLASAAAGVSAILQPGALTNAPVVSSAAGVGSVPWGGIRIPAGANINLVIGVGSTTGTWKHYLSYIPIENFTSSSVTTTL